MGARRRGGAFFLGWLLGFFTFLVLLVGGGLLCYFKLDLKTVENVTGIDVPVGNDEFKDLPVKDLIAVLASISGSGEMTIGELDEKYGLTLPDELNGLKLARFKEVIRDCRYNDIPGILNALTAEMNLGEVLEMAGSNPDEMTTMGALKGYTINDLLGKEEGIGLEGILSEVTIGELVPISDDSDEMLKVLKDFTVLGENGISSMGERLTLSALNAFGIDLSSNAMLESLASMHMRDLAGNLLFADGESLAVFADGTFYEWTEAEDGTETRGEELDLSGYFVVPSVQDGQLETNAAGEICYRAGDQTVYYRGAEDCFVTEDGTEFAVSADQRVLKAKTPYLGQLGEAVNELTLQDVLGEDNVPDVFRRFADVKVSNLGSELSMDKIKLSDLVPEGSTDGFLFELGTMQAIVEISVPGSEEPIKALRFLLNEDGTERILYRQENAEVYYEQAEDGTFGPVTLTEEQKEKLQKDGFSVSETDKAINRMTIGSIFGDQANTGSLSLIGGETRIEDIPEKMDQVIMKTSLFALQQAGLIDESTNLHKTINGEEIGNWTLQDILDYLVTVPDFSSGN